MSLKLKVKLKAVRDGIVKKIAVDITSSTWYI